MPVTLPVPQAGEPGWAMFLDVDGTLLSLAEHPDAVVVPEGLPRLLARLKAALGGALALVSGRSLASLDALLGEAGLDAAGCHGAEIRQDGTIRTTRETGVPFPRIAERLAQLSDGIPHTMVELKPHSVAFHYRPKALDALRARQLAVAAIAGEEGRLRLLDGKQVVEILPQTAGKGAVIGRFLDRPPFRDRIPVFVGDDVTDEEGFREVNARQGISIHVGRDGGTSAQYSVASASDVLAWLSGPVCRSLGCHLGKGAP